MANFVAMLKDISFRSKKSMNKILTLINKKMDEHLDTINETTALSFVASDLGIFKYDQSIKGRIKQVASESGISIEEVNALIMEQIEDFSGLIDEDGGIVLVAKELGVKLHYDD